MGRDKGLILREGTPWAMRMGEKLAAFHLPVVYSINAGQWDAYARLIPRDQLVVDSLDLAGPLNGLLSVHLTFPAADVLMIACDMQDIDSATIQHVIGTYHESPAYEFYVYQDGAFAQPFCGIYKARGLARAYRLALQGDLPDRSLQSLISSGQTYGLAMIREEAFRNYNSM